MEAVDITTITGVISSIGFPIVACIALFYLYDKTITKLTSTLEKVDKTLDKICERMDKVESVLKINNG